MGNVLRFTSKLDPNAERQAEAGLTYEKQALIIANQNLNGKQELNTGRDHIK